MNFYRSTISCLGVLVFSAGTVTALGSPLPQGLVKVSDDTNPKCVEFVTYKGEMYCSLQPVDNAPANPQVVSEERFKVMFDNRPWKAAWTQKNSQIATIEYIPLGDDINNWHELITTQFMPGLDDVSAQEFGNRFLKNLDKSGITYKVTSIVDKPEELIFEFRVEKPVNLQQDEIQKVIKTKEGIYIIHYAVKKSDMGKVSRQKWIEKIKSSTLKN